MMDDLVSRKSAIEIVKGIDRHFAKYIEELPSAKPYGDAVSRNAIVQKLNKMDRYVSAELRLCDTDKKFPQNEVFIVDDVYEEIVEQLPSVQPDIITCGDCKWLIRHDKRCGYWNHGVKPTMWCSQAKRREVTE